MSVQLITDSTSDFTKEEWTGQGVEVVSLNVDFAGNQYKDRQDLMPDAFYELLEESETLPKTSQPARAAFWKFSKSIRTRKSWSCLCQENFQEHTSRHCLPDR